MTIIEYIYMNENSILLIIFKEKNLSKNWLSKQVSKEWHVSANLIEWISNIHGQKWLEKCFKPITWEKVNE